MKIRSVAVVLIFAAMVGALMFMGLSEQPKAPEQVEESVESYEESVEAESYAESSAESSESDSTPESSEESESEKSTESYVYYIETSPENSPEESPEYIEAESSEESIESTPESSAESSVPVSDWDYYDGGRYGDKGRLIIPSVGVSVALYQCDWFDKTGKGQACVDNYDSAAWLVAESIPEYWADYFDNSVIIADHTEQGFNAIKSMTYGDIAYIYNNGTCEKYEYVKTDYNGSNVENYIPERNYNLWKPKWSNGQYATIGHEYPEYITMYTCNDWYGSITLVLLKRMG